MCPSRELQLLGWHAEHAEELLPELKAASAGGVRAIHALHVS